MKFIDSDSKRIFKDVFIAFGSKHKMKKKQKTKIKNKFA